MFYDCLCRHVAPKLIQQHNLCALDITMRGRKCFCCLTLDERKIALGLREMPMQSFLDLAREGSLEIRNSFLQKLEMTFPMADRWQTRARLDHAPET